MSGVRGGEAAGTPALQLSCSGSEEEVAAGTCAVKAPAWELRPLYALRLEIKRFPDGGCKHPNSSR